MPYYFDTIGILIMLPAIFFAMYAQFKVQSTYRQYSGQRASRGYTGAEAARMILDRAGLYAVLIEETRGTLSDHYDPRSNIVRLSSEVYHGATVAAVGIAAHECGHAIQHAEHYAPIRLRNAIIPITNIGSRLSVPILLVGFLMNLPALIFFGIAAYAMMTLFQLVTLPVEFNASARALRVIDEAYLLDDNDRRGAKKVLTAAAMTYVAALLSSAAQLLRLVLLSNRRRR